MEKINIPEKIRKGRANGTPLFAIETPDSAPTEKEIEKALGDTVPLIRWDPSRGLTAINTAGGEALTALETDGSTVLFPEKVLLLAGKLPQDSALFIYQADRALAPGAPQIEAVIAAVFNLRDEFKTNGRALILLGISFQLPPELAQMVDIWTESYPDDKDIRDITLTQFANVRKSDEGLTLDTYPDPTSEQMDRIIDGARGLCSFPIEQIVSSSLTKSGITLEDVYRKKTTMIGQVIGLTVYQGTEDFSHAGGLTQAKAYLTKQFHGPKKPRVYVWIDEIEKLLAGTSGDTSGVSQDQLHTILTQMDRYKWKGMLAAGHPGVGKSLLAQTAAKNFNGLCINFDTGATKGSLVGESEKNIRAAFAALEALGQDRVFIIATCNAVETLSPALRRRFGTPWFFDIEQDQEPIWKICLAKHGIDPDQARPATKDWTGAEINQLCSQAYELQCSLVEAADYVIPIILSDPDGIAQLRNQASGHWLDAAHPGAYHQPAPKKPETGRKIKL